MSYDVTIEDMQAFAETVVEMRSSDYFTVDSKNRLHPINSETGLPTLPEGYFWRVERERDADVISLMFENTVITYPKSSFFGGLLGNTPHAIQHHTMRKLSQMPLSLTDSPEAELVDSAYFAIRLLAEKLNREFGTTFIEYYGDYPPKSLIKD